MNIKCAIIDEGLSPFITQRDRLFTVNAENEILSFIKEEVGWESIKTHGDKCYSIIKDIYPQADFYSIKVLDSGEMGNIGKLKAALEWCYFNNVKLIHLSIGTIDYYDAKRIQKNIEDLVKKDTFIIASFSNRNIPTWPACFPGVFGVRYDRWGLLQEGTIAFQSDFPFAAENSLLVKHDAIIRGALEKGDDCSSNSYASPIITGFFLKLLEKKPKATIKEAFFYLQAIAVEKKYREELFDRKPLYAFEEKIPMLFCRETETAALIAHLFRCEGYNVTILSDEVCEEVPLFWYRNEAVISKEMLAVVAGIYFPDLLIVQAEEEIFSRIEDFDLFLYKSGEGFGIVSREGEQEYVEPQGLYDVIRKYYKVIG